MAPNFKTVGVNVQAKQKILAVALLETLAKSFLVKITDGSLIGTT